MPAAVETSPIWAAGYPSRISRMVTTKKQALTSRLLSRGPHHQRAEERLRPR